MRVSVARLTLFLLWLVLWVTYVLVFYLTTKKDGVTYEQATDAVWKITYALFPIVSAFANYWFATEKTSANPPPASAVLPAEKYIPLFAITVAVNLVVAIPLVVGIILPDFNDPNARISYSERADGVIKLMVFLGGFVSLPVGFLLGKAPTGRRGGGGGPGGPGVGAGT